MQIRSPVAAHSAHKSADLLHVFYIRCKFRVLPVAYLLTGGKFMMNFIAPAVNNVQFSPFATARYEIKNSGLAHVRTALFVAHRTGAERCHFSGERKRGMMVVVTALVLSHKNRQSIICRGLERGTQEESADFVRFWLLHLVPKNELRFIAANQAKRSWWTTHKVPTRIANRAKLTTARVVRT